MKRPVDLKKRAAILARAARDIQQVAFAIVETGWMQDRVEFAADLVALQKRIHAEGKASLRLEKAHP